MIISIRLNSRCHSCGLKRKVARFMVEPEKYQHIWIAVCEQCAYSILGSMIFPGPKPTTIEELLPAKKPNTS